MRSKNILVTGAAGFTGSWLTQHLLDVGASITTLQHEVSPHSIFARDGLAERVRVVRGSILDFDLLVRVVAEHRIDTVFHLAAVAVEHQAYHGPTPSFEVNIRGTYYLLEACRRNAGTVRGVIVASSDKAYGDAPCLPYREEMPVQGMNPYDVSKACADLIGRSYHHSYGLRVAVARFANVYGGGDLNWSRLVPNTIRRLLVGEPPVARFPPAGEFKRDFLYVKDQVRAYSHLLAHMDRPDVHGQAFNFGTGQCLAVRDVIATIQRLMRCEHVAPRAELSEHAEILHQQLASEKARRVLGWVPEYSLEKGLSETIGWYEGLVRGTPPGPRHRA